VGKTLSKQAFRIGFGRPESVWHSLEQYDARHNFREQISKTLSRLEQTRGLKQANTSMSHWLCVWATKHEMNKCGKPQKHKLNQIRFVPF